MTDLKAYQAFMLRGKGVAPVKQPTSSTKDERNSGGSASGSGKKNKSDVVVLRAFQGRLQEWKDTDHQLEAVLSSMANLRDRIWWETQQMETIQAHKPWEKCSFRPSFMSEMTLDDVQLALTHDLLQHEKMMVNGRKLIANLAQTQDGMGRRLDEWMMMNHDSALSPQGLMRLEQAQDIYRLLAEKLYARQELLKSVLDSSQDGLVDRNSVEMDENPRVVIRKVLREWKCDDGIIKELVDDMLAA